MSDEKGNGYGYLENNPTLKGASVAVAHSANAADGNVAIGAYSQALMDDEAKKSLKKKSVYTDEEAFSYVSVGGTVTTKDTSGNSTTSPIRRRISNVAGGVEASDAATVGQLQKAIDSIGTTGWKLRTNSDDTKAATITSGTTVDFSPAVDGKNGTADHSNVTVSNTGSNVKIGLNRNIVLGEATSGNGGSLNVYSDSTEASNLGNRVSIDGSTVSVNYGSEEGTSGTKRGVVLGVGEDWNHNAQGYIAFNNIDPKGKIDSTYLHSATDAPDNLKGRLVYSNTMSGTEYIANLDDGITFTGDVNSTVPEGYTQTPTKLNTTLNIMGGAKTTDDLTSGNIGVVSTPAAEKEDGTTQASKLEIKLNKDLKGITSITSSTTNSTGAKIELGEKGTTISGGDINVSGSKVTGLKDGENETDAVTVKQLNEAKTALTVKPGWGIEKTDDNTISVKHNLGKNYGNKYDGKGKVTFEADGKNSLILGGGAINDSWDEADKDFTYGAHAKDSVLVGGMNNDIDKNSERALIVGGINNKTFSTGEVQQTGTDAIIVGGADNKAEGDGSVLIGGNRNEASGLYSMTVGGSNNKNEGWLSSIFGGTSNNIKGDPTGAAVFGGTSNTIEGEGIGATIFGGEANVANNLLAVVVGGEANHSSGNASAILGGNYNLANGTLSIAIGGQINNALGDASVVVGGGRNLTSGIYSYASGGLYNKATGLASSALGGRSSSVNGMFSTGVAGGSTGQDAFFSLAAGYKSVVADSGVEKTFITGDEFEKIQEDIAAGKELSGFYMGDPSDMPELGHTGTLIHYDKFSTALGYQATADEAGTIAFGHDAGDESGYTYEWEQLPKDKDGNQTYANDGTTNDYTKAPKSIKKNAPYTSAYYNRLVKVADGIDDHDVVVMEQLKQYAEKDASNIGNNLTVAPVYQKDDQNNIKLGADSKPLVDEEATQKKLAEAQKANKDAWGLALGAGTLSTADAAKNSDQLITGKTLYNYDKPTTNGTYVNQNQTTGQNLSALDTQVKANTDALTKPNHNIKYYSVTAGPSLGYDQYTNENNDGAKGTASLAAGNVTHTDGAASTVVGSYSAVFGTGLQGAAALSYGTVNVNNNTDTTKKFSGVANSIVGQANMTTNSNAAIIYGAGNTVTNSYRPIDEKKAAAILGSVNDPAQLGEAMKDAVESSGGQVMVMGGGNNVESAYMTQVVGVGNTVKGNQVYTKDAKTGEWNWATDTNDKTAIKDYKPEKSSQYNYVDGFSNEVINGKHDYVIGANNKLSGDSYDDDTAQPIKRSNRSNIVIGDNHILTREQNTVIIGSSDTENTQTKARDAVIIGHNANATNDTGADNAVAIGRSATATGGNAVTIGVNTSAGENSITIGSESHAIYGSNIAIGRYAKVDGNHLTNAVALGTNAEAQVTDGVAIGSGSIATVAGNSAEGYNPVTGIDSTDKTAIWKATKAAVSIGKADGTVTRQINGLAAGTNDTDAVNVAQLKKLEGMKANVNATNIGKNLKGADGKTAASDAEKTANENAWGTAIGTGEIAEGNGQLVTGKTVYAYNKPVAETGKTLNYVSADKTTGQNLTTLDEHVKTNADAIGTNTKNITTNTTNITKNAGDITNLKNLSNITDEGRTVIKNLSKDAVKVAAGDRITVAEEVDSTTGNKTYTVSAKNDGQVASGNTGLISGDTLYKEVHVDKDGSYIKGSQSVGKNLSALDSGLKTTSDLIHMNDKGDIQIGGSSTATKIDVSGKDAKGNTTGRFITGVVTDAGDPTSAANVGYVNGVTAANTQQIYRDMNNAYGRLNNNINKAAAGSNALAALHPLDYDPDDKADFAVGYGHYRNANAAAVGAFYHPNENTMVNVGVSLGNGDPGFNAGVSFKIGSGSAGHQAMSKTEMAKVINSQSKEIDALKKDNADKDKRIDALEQKMAEILAKLDKNGK